MFFGLTVQFFRWMDGCEWMDVDGWMWMDGLFNDPATMGLLRPNSDNAN